MTRLMGDATHANVPALARAGTAMVAGYVTGDATVRWTAADWAAFPRDALISIDQGFTGSPVAGAIVRDVERGAWTAAAAVDRANWLPIRPTIYTAQNTLQGILDAGWRSDLWVAIVGWQPGQPWPAVVQEAIRLGCTVVAVQNQEDVAGAYDLSVVLDPTWPLPAAPKENDMAATLVYGQKTEYVLDGGRAHVVQSPADLITYQAAVTAGQMNVIGGPTQGGRLLTTAEEEQFVKDFPAGNPAVTVPALTFPTLTVTPSA